MPYNVKEIVANKPSRFTAGHRMCAGCGAPPIARMIMRALKPEDHAVVANAIMDRILHHAHVVPISGKSYRLKDHLKQTD